MLQTSEEFKALCLANYKEITGQDPIISEDKNLKPGAYYMNAALVRREPFAWRRQILVTFVDPREEDVIIMVAFKENMFRQIGVKTDNMTDSILGPADRPMSAKAKKGLRNVMEARLKEVGLV